jgi:uncharacterized protein
LQSRVIVLALLGTGLTSTRPIWAQQIPTAVISDPAPDKQFPPGLSVLTIPSNGSEMDAFLYLAAGSSPHGTVVLLHGLPGYEMNGDLAQSIRRAGWNVPIFNYRGTWGSTGTFSQSSAIEDTAAVVRFLRDPANVATYRIDPRRLVIIGHSFGGFLAGYEGSHDPDISAIGIISATNLGKINFDPKERDTRLKRWQTQLHPVHGATASDLFAEAERHAKEWDYVQWADAFRTRPLLLVEADDQNHAEMEALASEIRGKGSTGLEQKVLVTDHSFSDHRIALQTIVIDWLQKLHQ